MSERKEKIKSWYVNNKRYVAYFFLVIALALYAYWLVTRTCEFLTKEVQIAENEVKYELFKDILFLIFGVLGVVIAVIASWIHWYISDSIKNKIEKQMKQRSDEFEKFIEEQTENIRNYTTQRVEKGRLSDKYFLRYSSSTTFLNIGYAIWLNYKISKDRTLLEEAINMTEKAYKYTGELDEKKPEYELLKCQIMNNLGYFLALRGKPEDRKFAISCAKFIINRVKKYPEERIGWQDTYDCIIKKYD